MTDVEEAAATPDAELPPPLAPEAVDQQPPPPPGKPRRTATRSRKYRTITVAVIAVAAAVTLPLLVIKATRTIANSKAGRTATTTAPATGSLPATPTAMLAEVGSDGHVGGLTLFTLGPSGSGGAVVVVPAGTEWTNVDGAAPARLGSAFDNGGLDAQRNALEGVLGITTSGAQQVDEAQLASLLAPYAPIHIVLDDRVLDTDSSGRERVLYPAGPVDLTAAQAAHLLLAHGPNESEIERLPRIQAIWTAVVSGAHKASSSATTSSPPTSGAGAAPAPPTTVAGQLAAMVKGTPVVETLPVKPVLDPVANPAGVDLLAPDNTGQKLMTAELMPGAISPANTNIRFRIENATGDPNMLYAAVGRLVFVGANVVIVSDAPAPTQQTVIEYQNADDKAEATTYLPVVGPAKVQPSTDRIDGIDATIILGKDFATFVAGQGATTPSTTSPAGASRGGSTTTTTS